ncbi:MAG: cytochrome c oxidase subunit II transmembrane domain-containing protein [Rhodospirillales bacterium]
MNSLARLAAALATAIVGSGALAGPARAEEPVLAVPHPWQMDLQAAGSPVAERLQALNTGVSVVIVIITLFVGALLAWVLVPVSRHAQSGAGDRQPQFGAGSRVDRAGRC